MSRDEGAEVMIATHNQKSIERAVSLMHELEVEPQNSGVYFGQLLGMADHLTFILGRNGFRVRKSSKCALLSHHQHPSAPVPPFGALIRPKYTDCDVE